MVMRTYGLSGSGMDIDSLVKDLMKARRARYDKVQQQRTQLEWKKEDYNSIYTLAQNFRNTDLANFRKQSNLSPKLVSSTNDAVVSATANGAAANIEHSIVVSQLAGGVKMTSSDGITPTGNYKGSLTAQFGIAAGTTLDFTINGKNIKVNVTDTTTLNNVASSINQADAGVKASYDATLDRFFLYTDKTGAAATINFNGTTDGGMDFLFNTLKLGGYSPGLNTIGEVSRNTVDAADYGTKTLQELYGISGDFQLSMTDNGVADTIDIAASDTLSVALDKINAKLGAGAATYDAGTGRITVKAVDPDHAYTLDGADATGKAFLQDNLGLVSMVQNGHDAVFNLDGVDLTQAANTFTVSGVTYNLKSVSLTNPDTGSPIATSVNVKADIEKTIDAVQSFVDIYNSFISVINKEVNEDRYRDYMPLTSEQKEAMSDSEAAAWEKKARSGILRNDSILSSALTTMRRNISTPISGLSGKYTSASSIGVRTGSYIDDDGNLTSEYGNGGKLYVDEDDLRAALEEDPDVVYKIFGNTESTTGVAGRLYDQFDEALKQLRTEAGYPNTTDTTSFLAKRLQNYDKQLVSMNDQLTMMENRYYRQFDAMEAALAQLNKQSSWLSQQFS
ncbi:flagellar filament capping protein FliD [Anaeroselena agilis]|uniref:Flagellar hook-associated protein 2 n=1 Tax=Anaeroselena agilis TaxID=3063788 RepID=A0ABU3P4E6_9FIRM|nr:flagellar filament capping protein FliD [Selenomonadales bacterium 4137-cl]